MVKREYTISDQLDPRTNEVIDKIATIKREVITYKTEIRSKTELIKMKEELEDKLLEVNEALEAMK